MLKVLYYIEMAALYHCVVESQMFVMNRVREAWSCRGGRQDCCGEVWVRLRCNLHFSGAHWCLDTPAVGSLMMSCLPYAHNTRAKRELRES